MTVTWWKVWEKLVEKGQLSPKALLRREKNKRHPWRPRVRRGMRAWRAARERGQMVQKVSLLQKGSDRCSEKGCGWLRVLRTECPQGQSFTGQGILDNTTALISSNGHGLCVRSCHTIPLCLTNPQDISRGTCRWCLQTEGTYQSSRCLSKKWRSEGGGGAKVGGAEHPRG